MASYTEDFKSKMNWGNVLERAAAAPLDRSSMFASYADAVLYAKGDGSDVRGFGATSYIGQVISVYENDTVKVYAIDYDRSLLDLSDSKMSTVKVDNYLDAIAVAEEGTEGRIAYVMNKTYEYVDENGETQYTKDEETASNADENYKSYDAGAYIVSGNGTLQKLAQSSASGDIEGDVTALQSRVTVIENSLYIKGDDID